MDRHHETSSPVAFDIVTVAAARCVDHFVSGHTDSWGACTRCIEAAVASDPRAGELLDPSRGTTGWDARAKHQPAGGIDRGIVRRGFGRLARLTGSDAITQMVDAAWNRGTHLATSQLTGEIALLVHHDGAHGHRGRIDPDDPLAFAVACERCALVVDAAAQVLHRQVTESTDPLTTLAENLESRTAIKNLVIEGQRVDRVRRGFRAKPHEVPTTLEEALHHASDDERCGWPAETLVDLVVKLSFWVADIDTVDPAGRVPWSSIGGRLDAPGLDSVGDRAPRASGMKAHEAEDAWEIVQQICSVGRRADLLWERLGCHMGVGPAPMVGQAVTELATHVRDRRVPKRLLRDVAARVFLEWVETEIGHSDFDESVMLESIDLDALGIEVLVWFRRFLKIGWLD